MSSLIARTVETCAYAASIMTLGLATGCADTSAASDPTFQLEEATITQIQQAILTKQVT